MCVWAINTWVCYYPLVQAMISISIALPAVIYIAIVKPHDCFQCLSIVPEMRITNFQMNHDERIRRDFEVRYGGCCSCFPTIYRRLRFARLISFENKVRMTSIPRGRDSSHFYEDQQRHMNRISRQN